MLNQSADHAVRAVLYLAQQKARRAARVQVIADALGVPRNYLGKVLNTLARTGVVEAVRGPRGGYRLAHAPEDISLAGVIEPFQQLPERRVCLLGNRPCDATRPCDAHNRWVTISDAVTGFFRDTTVAVMLDDTPERNGAHHE